MDSILLENGKVQQVFSFKGSFQNNEEINQFSDMSFIQKKENVHQIIEKKIDEK